MTFAMTNITETNAAQACAVVVGGRCFVFNMAQIGPQPGSQEIPRPHFLIKHHHKPGAGASDAHK